MSASASPVSPTTSTVPTLQLHNIEIATVQEHYPSPVIAQGPDWSRNLIHLAKTAELRKHALNLQLHTAHILSAHASLDDKSKTLQDVQEQRNRLYYLFTRFAIAHRGYRFL